MATRVGVYTSRFFDHFNDGSTAGWTVDTPVGSVSEVGSSLNITVSGAGNWWTGGGTAPVVYKTFASEGLDGKPVRIEARLTNLTNTGDINTGPQIWSSRTSFNLSGYEIPGGVSRSFLIRIHSGGATDVQRGPTIVNPSITPHRYVIYYNPSTTGETIFTKEDGLGVAPGDAAYYYSEDDGASYDLLVNDTGLNFSPTRFGLYTKNFNAYPTSTASYDWIDVAEFTGVELREDEIPTAVVSSERGFISPSAGVVAYQALGAFGPALWKWTLASGWHRIDDPPRNIYSMCAHSEYDVWLAATYGSGEIELYHYDGLTFRLQTLPGNGSGSSTKGVVRFWDDQTVYFWGSANGPRGFWRTTTGGPLATWTKLSDEAWFSLNCNDLLVVGADEAYVCGASGGLPGGQVGVGYYSPGTGFAFEQPGHGLEQYDPEIGNNQNFVAMAWDKTNPDEVWLIDTGKGGSVGSKLYKGKIGGPWTLAVRFDSSMGYASRYLANIRSMVMDKHGILYIICNEDGVDPGVIIAGDPRLAQPSFTQVANPSASVGLGDRWATNDYVFMADNATGQLYIPGTGWTTPSIDPGNYYGQALAGFPEPEYTIEETVTAVDTVTVVSTSIPPSDDEWILLSNDQWIKPDQDPPMPDPDRAAYYGGGSSAIAWDSRRRRVVLLTEPTTIGILQPWDYIPDSNSWVLRAPFGGMPDIHYPTSASKDLGLAACFDGVSDKVLIYALSKTTGNPTLWHWDASRITKLAPVGMPTVEEPQLVWDENRMSCWLYGYSPSSGQPYELYEFLPSLLTFVDRYVLHAPGNFPAGRRRGCGFAFDPNLNELVLTHGGIEPTLYADTWSFNPSTSIWTNRTPSGAEGTDYPERRTRTALVTGPDHELFLVGGYTTGEVHLRDTWKWEGDLGTWTDIPPSSVMITDVNANMRVIGRYPPRIIVPTQPRIGVDVGVGQVDEALTAVDDATVVAAALGWDYLRDSNLPTGVTSGDLGAWFIFDGTGSSLTDLSGSGTDVFMSHGSENYVVEPESGLIGNSFSGSMMRSSAVPTWLISNAITCEIQLRTSDTDVSGIFTVDRYGPETLNTNGQWTWRINGGTYDVFWEYGSGANVQAWLGGGPTGNLQHLIFTRQSDGLTVTNYINGVKQLTSVAGHVPEMGSTPDVFFMIGGEFRVPATLVGTVLSVRILPGVVYTDPQALEAYLNTRI